MRTTPKDVQIFHLIEAEASIADVRDRMLDLRKNSLVSDKVRQNWLRPLYLRASRSLCRELHQIGLWEEIYADM